MCFSAGWCCLLHHLRHFTRGDNTLSAQVHPTQPTPSYSSLSTLSSIPLHHHIPCNCPPPSIRSSSQQARSIFEHIGKSSRNSFPDVLVAHSALLFRHQPTNRTHCQHLIFFFLSPIHHPCCCHCTTYRSRQVFSPLSPISTCYLLYLHQLVIN